MDCPVLSPEESCVESDRASLPYEAGGGGGRREAGVSLPSSERDPHGFSHRERWLSPFSSSELHGLLISKRRSPK